MIRRPPRSTRTDTLFPYTTLFRSDEELVIVQLPTQLHRHIWGKSIISLPILPPSAARAPRWTLFATAVQAVSAEYWRRLHRCKKAVAHYTRAADSIPPPPSSGTWHAGSHRLLIGYASW